MLRFERTQQLVRLSVFTVFVFGLVSSFGLQIPPKKTETSRELCHFSPSSSVASIMNLSSFQTDAVYSELFGSRWLSREERRGLTEGEALLCFHSYYRWRQQIISNCCLSDKQQHIKHLRACEPCSCRDDGDLHCYRGMAAPFQQMEIL